MRLPQIDLLRGVAVLLVLFRHHWAGIDVLQKIGWIGVDLFFVLSGFLVSGLLFAEYKEFGNIRPFYFLLRRGFKIYPLLYLSIIASTILSWDEITSSKLVGEIFFIQNYYDSIWGHHWSLAVEEHFYVLIAILAYFFVPTDRRMIFLAAVIFFGCYAFRVFGADSFSSHVRLDSLFMGVCIAYYYHFHDLLAFYKKHRRKLIALCFIPLIICPIYGFYDPPMRLIGLSLLYVSFGSLLVVSLNRPPFGGRTARMISTIGVYSYGIYLFHMYPIRYIVGTTYLYGDIQEVKEGLIASNWWISFSIYFVLSIALGMGMSYYVEKPFLYLRDRKFPKREKDELYAVSPSSAVA